MLGLGFEVDGPSGLFLADQSNIAQGAFRFGVLLPRTVRMLEILDEF